MNEGETIFNQLGGYKFVVMTGAKDFVTSNDSCHFKIGKGAKGGINAVRIVLKGDDTYIMSFFKMKRYGLDVTEVKSVEGVTFDSLQSTFTQITGFETHL